MQVKTLIKKLPLSLSPYESYHRLTHHTGKAHTALLETAEAGTHQHRKSIIMLSAAVEISCTDKRVSIKALNENGVFFIQSLNMTALEGFEVTKTDKEINFKLKNYISSTNESVRLKESSTLHILRNINDQLNTGNDNHEMSSCLIGAFSFDYVDQFEALTTVDKLDEDYCFYLADQRLIQAVDNQSAQIVVNGFGDNANNVIRLGLNIENIEQALSEPFEAEQKISRFVCEKNTQQSPEVDLDDELFKEKVEAIKEHIISGDVFQTVLARTFKLPCPEPYKAYGELRKSNPSPYMYYMDFGLKQLFGASPESALKVNVNKEVLLYPIAGTRKRPINNGQIDFNEDSKTEFELVQDEKECAEHMMLVDLARNDIARIVKTNSRQISQLKTVVKYSHVMHLVSEVKGVLKDDLDVFDAYRACANMGTLTGAPKIKAMNIIRYQEQKSRGFYGGAVSIINSNQEFDSAIIIRSAMVRDGMAHITAGAGIVNDSIPQDEADETSNKAQAVINACLVALKSPVMEGCA